MKRLKRLFVLSLLTVTAVFTAGTNEANAASKLTPEHLYTWAKDNDTARLNKYKHYINIENQDKNTALCLAQQDQNRDAYALLLQFGASTKVPCHNDNDPVCAMIVGEKIKVSPAGMALIGAGAAAAGAYALLHDDDDKGCNVKNYPLAECPEHGHCSECKDKKRLDTCDEFWTPNADKTACIPADCPANQYTSCEDKADHITTATPTTGKSGDQQCYQCSYKCNETDNRYDNLGFCAAAHAGIVCELNENQCWYPARCDTAKGYYDTDADCRTGNFGYTCKIAANNCYEKDVCDVANGHHPDQTSCENANTGYHCTQQENLCWQPDFTLLTECPSGSHTALCETKTGVISTSNATGKSGPDDCLACDYKCDSANGWKQGTSAADCPLGRICSDISINDTNRGQTLTCYHDDGCPTDYTYTSQSTCEEGGYTCAESAAGSQCWKRTGNADCPDTHPNRNQCQEGTGYTNGQTQTQVGDAPCYNCNYQCDTANNWLSACPSGKVCSEITMPSGAKCYTPTGCDTSNGYFDNTNTCQNANPEHICTLDSTGCYVVGACDAANGYYASDTACTTANPSYTCVKTEHNCYIKNAPAACPVPSHINSCLNTDGIKTTPTVVGKSGEDDCYDCTYLCDTANGWQSGSESNCPTGWICKYASLTDPYRSKGADCYKKDYCNTTQGYYDTDSACTTANSEYTCIVDATGCYTKNICNTSKGYYATQSLCEQAAANVGYQCAQSAGGCWKKSSTPATCPTSSSTAQCSTESKNGIIATSTKTGTSGTADCLECDYKCNTAAGWNQGTSAANCPDGRVCSDTSINDTARGKTLSCYHDDGCPTDYTYTSETTCKNGGYTCEESAAGSGCWKRNGNQDCPEGYQETACTNAKTGITLIPATPVTVGSRQCYKCEYECNGSLAYKDDSNISICGSKASNGWKFINSVDQGTASCAQCQEKPCPAGTATSKDSCDKYNSLTAAQGSASGSYHGEATCYTCTYSCNVGAGYYSSSAQCEDGGTYTCSQVEDKTGYTCYIRQGDFHCPSGQQSDHCTASATGFKTTETAHTYDGGTCYSCSYACDTANGWQSSSTCPAGKSCPDGTNKITTPVACVKPICPTSHSYTNKTTCETGGYVCAESATNSGCFGRTGNQDCPSDYPDTSCATPAQDGIKLSTEEKTVGSRQCYKCTYACDTANGWKSSNCPIGTAFTGTCNTEQGITCGKITGCNVTSGYKNTTAITNCGSKGSNGWTFVTPYQEKDGTSCATCKEKDCPAGTATSKDSCDKYNSLTASQGSASGSYHGEATCYTCTYSCNVGAGYYSTAAQCEDGGTYTCSQVEDKTDYPCYIRQGDFHCPPGQQADKCSSGTGYNTNETAHPYTDGTCYSCEYTCDTDNGWQSGSTCPAGKSCPDGTNKITTPVACIKPVCDTSKGYYDTDSACTTANSEYTCIVDATGCYTKNICNTSKGYYATKDICEQAAANVGYQCAQSAGGCWKKSSTPATCPAYTGTDYDDDFCLSDSPPYLSLPVSTGTGVYSGGEECLKCVASCDEVSNAFSSLTECQSGGFTCSTTNAPKYDATCHHRTTTCPAGYGEEICGEDTEWILINTKDTKTFNTTTCYKCEYLPVCTVDHTWQYTRPDYETTNTGEKFNYEVPDLCNAENGYHDNTSDTNLKYCGTTGSNGWLWTDAKSECGLSCAKCQTKTCPSGSATTENQCLASYALTVSLSSSSTGYSGESTCHTCTYTCNNANNYFSLLAQCTAKFSNCSAISQQGVTCYTPTDAEQKNCPANYIDSDSLPRNTEVFNYGSVIKNPKCNITLGTDCNYCVSITGCKYASKAACIAANGSCTLYMAGTGTGLACYGPEISTSALSNMTYFNTDVIEKTSTGSENITGITSSGDIENAALFDEQTGEVLSSGHISLIHNSTGTATGIKGIGANQIANRQFAEINIKNNAGGTAIGIHADQGGSVINEGLIKIEGQSGTAIGILGEGANHIVNAESGVIDVEGAKAYGIYVKDGEGSLVENKGIIKALGDEAHGIYIEKNATVDTVLNSGSIYVNGTEKGNAGITLNGADLRNESLLSFSGKANLNALDGRVYLEKGGSIEAQALEGDLTLGVSNVLGSNEDTYVAEGALQTEDLANLNLISESALFKAKATADGNTVLERESFDKFTPNASIAKYLTSNYEQGKLVEMYDAIKNQTEAQKARRLIAKDLGYDTMPNFADENFMALKSLNRNIADTILQPSDENYRVVAGADSVSLETKNKAVLSGYDLSASSMYTFGDKRLDNKNRLGLGLSFTKLSSSYDRGGDRDLNIVSLFIPYLHKFTDKLNLASILSFGYGYGDLERGGNKKADINDIFYGFTNELRYSMDLNGFASLEPALYLNAIGYTEDGLDEGSENLALETGRTHNLSIEAGVGLFLKKQVSLEKYGKLGFKIGGAYYRELGSPYDDIKARIKSGNRSWYRMNDYANIYTHDRALIEAVIDYEYKDLSIYAKFNQIIQKNNPKLFDLGIKYKF